MDRNDIKNAKDFREALIGITNYMAFYNKEVCSTSEPIEVKWGLKEDIKMVMPVITLVDRMKY